MPTIPNRSMPDHTLDPIISILDYWDDNYYWEKILFEIAWPVKSPPSLVLSLHSVDIQSSMYQSDDIYDGRPNCYVIIIVNE